MHYTPFGAVLPPPIFANPVTGDASLFHSLNLPVPGARGGLTDANFPQPGQPSQDGVSSPPAAGTGTGTGTVKPASPPPSGSLATSVSNALKSQHTQELLIAGVSIVALASFALWMARK